MDEKIKKLLKSMIELGNKLRNESLKKKERLRLKREWKLKDQELMNYMRKLEMKMRDSEMEMRTEERKKLSKEYRTIMKITYNSNPNIDHSWNPLKIQRIIESVHEKALEKRLNKSNLKKERSMPKKRIWFIELKWTVRIKELANTNLDPKLVRPVLLAWKDYDEGKIDQDTLKRVVQEFSHPTFSKKKFIDKYPILNPSPPKK